MEQQSQPTKRMWTKSTENLLFAENALKSGWCSAGMSRCYYAMRHAVLDYAAELLRRGEYTTEEYRAMSEGPHGRLLRFASEHLPEFHRSLVVSRSRRNKADYFLIAVTADERAASLADAVKIRDSIRRKLGEKHG